MVFQVKNGLTEGSGIFYTKTDPDTEDLEGTVRLETILQRCKKFRVQWCALNDGLKNITVFPFFLGPFHDNGAEFLD